MLFNFDTTSSLISRRSRYGLLLPFSFSLLFVLPIHAHDVGFPIDPERKVVYHATIKCDSIPFSILWQNGIEIMETFNVPDIIHSEMKADMNQNTLMARYGFYLYQKKGFTKQIFGRMDADIQLTIDTIASDLRIDKIYFIEYHRGRDAQFKPKSSKKYYLGQLLNKQSNKIERYYPDIDENYKNIVEKITLKLVNY